MHPITEFQNTWNKPDRTERRNGKMYNYLKFNISFLVIELSIKKICKDVENLNNIN